MAARLGTELRAAQPCVLCSGLLTVNIHTLYLASQQRPKSTKPLHCQLQPTMQQDLAVCGAHVAEHTPSTAGLLDMGRKLSSDMDATSLAPAPEFCVIISSSTRSIKFPKRQSSATIRSYRLVKRCSTACITGPVIRNIKCTDAAKVTSRM
jgi:hypothetical protein